MVVPLCDTGMKSGTWVKSKNASAEEDILFCQSTFISCSEHRDKIQAEVLSAHETVKLALFFFRAFCLHRGSVPEVNHSSMLACLNRVTTSSNCGVKCKSSELGAEMQTY